MKKNTDADISIIVPIYNSEKTIKKCLDSIINQTKKELEIILINDGSTDKTEKIIKTYKDDRIKYFKRSNQGIGKSRNFGIEKSNSKYIMFLDSDDYLDEKACEKLFNEAEKYSYDLVICNFYRVIEDNLIKETIPSINQFTLLGEPEILLKVNLSPWNKIYKSNLLKDNNIKFEENLKYEDAPFVIKALYKANKIGQIKDYLNYYVIHSNSETTVRDKKVFDILKIIDIIRNNLKNEEVLSSALDELTIQIISNYNIQQRVQKDKEVGMKFIDESFKYLEENIPNYKQNNYYKKRGIKGIIEKSKFLTKVYCKLYR